jgi:crotonobetainyl-CoA:carnitine CoA-transferase CaiB-like acyl-CoA transferase
MDHDTILKRNPKIIYVAASGYGPNGPEAKEPAFDMIGLARSGISSLLSYEGDPNLPFHGGIADQMGAIMTAYGILSALLARERQGITQKVDVSHLGSMMALQGLNIGMSWLTYPDGPPLPLPEKLTRKNAANPLWNYYKCKDGRWLCLGMLQPDVKWSVVCKALGIVHLEKDPRYIDQAVRRDNSASLIAVMDEIFITKTADEWMQHLKATGDIICTPVQTLQDLRTDPQVLANGYLVECEHEVLGKVKVRGSAIAMSKTPVKIKPEAPEIGQHTEEVMNEILGYTWEEIGKLKEMEVI